jgi:hypothetical protein
MPETPEDDSVSELRILLEENRRSIETLRDMIENLEVLLATLSQSSSEHAEVLRPANLMEVHQPEP